MQIFGFLEKAQMENVSADLTNTLAGLVWFNTTDNKMRFYDNGAIRSVVDENSTQTLSDKTFTSGAISNFLDFAHQTTPASPTAGSISVYSKNDNKLYKLDSDGFEEEIGTGGGSGDINFCENPNAEKDIEGWNLYNDGAVEKPIDGTGAGGGTAGLLFLRYTGAPLRGDASFLFRTASSGANCYGQGYSNDFTIDPADQANMVDVIFDYRTEDAYATGDYVAYVYDITNAKLIEFSDGTIEATTFKKTFRRSFQAAADSMNYRVIVHCTANDTTQRTIIFDDVKYAPTAPAVEGLVGTNRENYTPSYCSWTNTTLSGSWYRVGENLHATIKATCNGTPGPSGAIFSISLPDGLTTDTLGSDVTVGTASGLDSGSAWVGGNAYVVSTTTIGAMVADSNVMWKRNRMTTTYPNVIVSGDTVTVNIVVKIHQWSSNMALSEATMNREISARSHSTASNSIANNLSVYLDFENNDYIKGGNNIVNAGAGVKTISADAWGYVVSENGRYSIKSNICFNAFGVSGAVYVYIKVNGAYLSTSRLVTSTTSANWSISVSDRLDLNKDDLVQIELKQVTGTSRTLLSSSSDVFFNIEKTNVGSQTIAASEKVVAMYSTTSGASFVDAVTVKVDYNIKEVDTHNAVTTGTGWAFTAPRNGYYNVSAAVAWANITNMTFTYFAVYKNGAVHRYLTYDNTNYQPSGSTLIQLDKGETCSIIIYQDDSAGASRSLSTTGGLNYVSIHSV